MSNIAVYGIPGSPFLRSVEITLKEKGVDYRFHPLAPGEHKQPDYHCRDRNHVRKGGRPQNREDKQRLLSCVRD